MWWNIIKGILNVVGVTAAVIVGAIVINGIITKSKLIQKLREKGINQAVVTMADRSKNVVKLDDLFSDESIEVKGDGISSDIHVRDVITV